MVLTSPPSLLTFTSSLTCCPWQQTCLHQNSFHHHPTSAPLRAPFSSLLKFFKVQLTFLSPHFLISQSLSLSLFFKGQCHTWAIWTFPGQGWNWSCSCCSTSVMATWNPSCLCDLCCSFQQRWILNPLSKARYCTHILTDTVGFLTC